MPTFRDMTKSQRRRLRELATQAYERELAAELAGLEQTFARWRGGELTVFEVEAAVHRFHQGPARELFKRYDMAPDWPVAAAIVHGILKEDEVPPEIRDLLRVNVDFLREQEVPPGEEERDPSR